MLSSDAQTWLTYLSCISAFYLLPLIISSRAKRDATFAARVVVALGGIVFVLITLLYPIGAGLVGPLSFADYFYALFIYLTPGVVVLLLWVGALRLLGKSAHQGRLD